MGCVILSTSLVAVLGQVNSCDDGWAGIECGVRCETCSHGTSSCGSEGNGQCECLEGWTGALCNQGTGIAGRAKPACWCVPGTPDTCPPNSCTPSPEPLINDRLAFSTTSPIQDIDIFTSTIESALCTGNCTTVTAYQLSTEMTGDTASYLIKLGNPPDATTLQEVLLAIQEHLTTLDTVEKLSITLLCEGSFDGPCSTATVTVSNEEASGGNGKVTHLLVKITDEEATNPTTKQDITTSMDVCWCAVGEGCQSKELSCSITSTDIMLNTTHLLITGMNRSDTDLALREIFNSWKLPMWIQLICDSSVNCNDTIRATIDNSTDTLSSTSTVTASLVTPTEIVVVDTPTPPVLLRNLIVVLSFTTEIDFNDGQKSIFRGELSSAGACYCAKPCPVQRCSISSDQIIISDYAMKSPGALHVMVTVAEHNSTDIHSILTEIWTVWDAGSFQWDKVMFIARCYLDCEAVPKYTLEPTSEPTVETPVPVLLGHFVHELQFDLDFQNPNDFIIGTFRSALTTALQTCWCADTCTSQITCPPLSFDINPKTSTVASSLPVTVSTNASSYQLQHLALTAIFLQWKQGTLTYTDIQTITRLCYETCLAYTPPPPDYNIESVRCVLVYDAVQFSSYVQHFKTAILTAMHPCWCSPALLDPDTCTCNLDAVLLVVKAITPSSRKAALLGARVTVTVEITGFSASVTMSGLAEILRVAQYLPTIVEAVPICSTATCVIPDTVSVPTPPPPDSKLFEYLTCVPAVSTRVSDVVTDALVIMSNYTEEHPCWCTGDTSAGCVDCQVSEADVNLTSSGPIWQLSFKRLLPPARSTALRVIYNAWSENGTVCSVVPITALQAWLASFDALCYGTCDLPTQEPTLAPVPMDTAAPRTVVPTVAPTPAPPQTKAPPPPPTTNYPESPVDVSLSMEMWIWYALICTCVCAVFAGVAATCLELNNFTAIHEVGGNQDHGQSLQQGQMGQQEQPKFVGDAESDEDNIEVAVNAFGNEAVPAAEQLPADQPKMGIIEKLDMLKEQNKQVARPAPTPLALLDDSEEESEDDDDRRHREKKERKKERKEKKRESKLSIKSDRTDKKDSRSRSSSKSQVLEATIEVVTTPRNARGSVKGSSVEEKEIPAPVPVVQDGDDEEEEEEDRKSHKSKKEKKAKDGEDDEERKKKKAEKKERKKRRSLEGTVDMEEELRKKEEKKRKKQERREAEEADPEARKKRKEKKERKKSLQEKEPKEKKEKKRKKSKHEGQEEGTREEEP